MSIQWVRDRYGVPAKVGGRVLYTGDREAQCGTIVGSRSGYLRIRMDGDKRAENYHPTWEIQYIEAATQPPTN